MSNNNNRRRRKKTTNLKYTAFALLVFAAALLAVLLVFFQSRTAEEAFNPEDFTNRTDELVNEEPLGDGKYIVALDAGHGGADGGAEETIIEKDMTELTVKYLEEYLLADENYKPVLCRPYGEGASINERSSTAKAANAQLLLSVHGNTDPTRTATGFECFPAPPGRTYHEDSLRFAHIIAGKMGEAGQRLRGENGVRYKYYEENSRGKTVEVIAEESVKEYNSAQSFGMVEKPGCAAVLAEQCFLTSKSDIESWASDEGCKKAARIYYESICEYFGTEPLE